MIARQWYTGAAVAAITVGLFAGCTTKKYVREQTTPLIERTNNLDAETAKNTTDIKTTDARIQKGLAQVNSNSDQAIALAQKAQTDENQVNTHLDQTSNQVQSLANTVANLDNYQLQNQSAVHFAFNSYRLTKEDQQTLDGVVGSLQQNPHAILEVKGYTDAIGPEGYNYKLSQWRADSVVNYLETHQVPAYKIFMIGLGKNQYVASNQTAAGRKENRRVELMVMTNALGQQQTASAQPASATQPTAATEPASGAEATPATQPAPAAEPTPAAQPAPAQPTSTSQPTEATPAAPASQQQPPQQP
jgi:OOP family OmpA-OmpF porin